MNVILLTVFIGLVLVFLFVALFWQHFSKPGSFSPDHESLLPLDRDFGFQEVESSSSKRGGVVSALAPGVVEKVLDRVSVQAKGSRESRDRGRNRFDQFNQEKGS